MQELMPKQDPNTGLWGFVNSNEELVIECKYYNAGYFNVGLSKVKLEEDGKWVDINTKGEIVCKR